MVKSEAVYLRNAELHAAAAAVAGSKLNPIGARNVISVQFAVITAVLIFLTLWRWFRLKESKVGGLVWGWGWGRTSVSCRQGSYVPCGQLAEFVQQQTVHVAAVSTGGSGDAGQMCDTPAATPAAAAAALVCSQVWEKEVQSFEAIRRTSQLDLDGHHTTDAKATPQAPHSKVYLLTNALSFFWPRLLATSLAWVCNGELHVHTYSITKLGC
jgi:hypothetical protein